MGAALHIARNPDPNSQLPYLVRIPLGTGGLVLKAREPWPRTAKVYCHRAEGWPEDADLIEEVAVRSCVRRGAAIDLVLDRARENRSQIVFTRLKDGREAIFWQSARTVKAARPGIRIPTRRASGLDELPIHVDSRERYPYRFAHKRVVVDRRPLPAGDYAVEVADRVAAVVERKSVADLAKVLIDGGIAYLLADLAAMPRAAVVVEGRYSELFKLPFVTPGFVPDLLGRVQVRYPNVPIVFCETRALAEEWTYRFLGAAVAELSAS